MALQDSDNLIVGRGDKPYRITYQELKDDLNIPDIKLTVGKGVITPTANLEAGDAVTGSATVTDAVNPVVVHVWSLDGVEVQRGSSSTYITAEGSVTYHQEVSDDTTQNPIIGDTSDPVSVAAPPPGPKATMSGLRFDSGRQTTLSRSKTNSSTFTLSFWLKTTSSSTQRIFQDDNGTSSFVVWIESGELRAGNSNGYASVSVNTSKWTNYVISYDGERISVSANGNTPVTTISTINLSNDGWRISGSSTSTVLLDGYLSDFYFVDGQVVPVTTFGKFFPGDKWGPLDSAVVQDKLNNLQPADPTPPPGPGAAGQPYDRRANTDQVWSDATLGGDTNIATSEIENAFDGNSGTAWLNYGSGEFTIAFGSPVIGNKLTANTGSDLQFAANDGDYSADGGGTVDIPGGTLTVIKVKTTSSSSQIKSFEVDGRLLVDQGVWNVSQNWSAGITGKYDTRGYTPAQGFNGEITGKGWNPYGTPESVWTLETPLTGIASFRIHGQRIDNPGNTIKVTQTDNSVVDISSQVGATRDWSTITGVTSIKSIEVKGVNQSTTFIGLDAFEINGAILVDSGAQWNTSQVWSNGGNDSELYSSSSWSMAFDGSIPGQQTASNTAYTSAGSSSTYTFPAPITGELTIYASGASSNNTANGTLTIGGSTQTVNNKDTSQEGYTFTLSGETTLDITGGNSGLEVIYMTLDGALLVDGTPVWNTDKIWSDGLSADPRFSASDLSFYAFNGDLINRASSSEKGDAGGTVTYNGSIPVTQKIEVLTGLGNTVTIDGTDAGSAASDPEWVELSGARAVSEIVVTAPNSSANRADIYAIRVDDEILVDAAYTWNSSQVWNNNIETNGALKFPLAGFDGNLNTKVEGTGGLKWTPDTPITFTDKVQVYAVGPNAYNINGLDWTDPNLADEAFGWIRTPASGFQGWLTIADGGGTLNVLNAIRWDNTGYDAGFSAVRVDGKILVDAGFGASGFYLPFDPAQTGANYSNGVISSDGSYFAGRPPSNLFNGDTSTQCSTSTQSVGVSLTASFSNISYTDRIQVFSLNTNTIQVNDKPEVPAVSGQWNTAATGGGTLSSIVFTSTNASGTAGAAAIMVDGVVLVDHSSIGVDMSGNNNNFVDQNFGVAGNSSQIWSDGGDDSQLTGTGSWNAAFDGSASTAAYIRDSAATYSFPPNTNGALTIYANSAGSQPGSVIVTVKGVSHTFSFTSVGQTASHTFASRTNLGDVTFAPSGIGVQINGFAIDGVKLIDPSFVDTVLDTPMKNYAVLTIGSNGNLEPAVGTTGDLTYSGETGETYYWEERDGPSQTWSAKTGVAPIKLSGNYDAANLGQQPFLFTGPQGNEQLLYQTWDEYARSTLGYALDRIAQLEVLRLEDSVTIEALRSDIKGALSRLASIESDEVNDDAVDNSLITLVGSLSSQITTWQTRIEVAEAALAVAVDRITTLENN